MVLEITDKSLHQAVSGGQIKMVEKLLSAEYASVMGFRADKPAADGTHNTPIHNAAYGKDLRILKLLYGSLPEKDRTAALNARQANDWTPLFEAVFIPRPPSDFAAGERDESGSIIKKRTGAEVEKYQKWHDRSVAKMPSVVAWLLDHGAASFDACAILGREKNGQPIGPTRTVFEYFEYIDWQISSRASTDREVIALKVCRQMISDKVKQMQVRSLTGNLKSKNEK